MASGTLVSEDIVLTAAHAFFNRTAGSRAVEVLFLPGLHGREFTWGAGSEGFMVHPEYEHSPNADIAANRDVAFVKLGRPLAIQADGSFIQIPEQADPRTLGERIGYFGIRSIVPPQSPNPVNTRVHITGYPGERNNTMYTQEGTITALEGPHVFYDIDSTPGQSGSGIWKIVQEAGRNCYVCVGVHTLSANPISDNQNVRRYNSGILFSQEDLLRFGGWFGRLERNRPAA
jgi:V8-like Glu-specific endopeptidase